MRKPGARFSNPRAGATAPIVCGSLPRSGMRVRLVPASPEAAHVASETSSTTGLGPAGTEAATGWSPCSRFIASWPRGHGGRHGLVAVLTFHRVLAPRARRPRGPCFVQRHRWISARPSVADAHPIAHAHSVAHAHRGNDGKDRKWIQWKAQGNQTAPENWGPQARA